MKQMSNMVAIHGDQSIGGSKTFSILPTLPSQTAKTILAAPNAANGTPSFRALVATDLPSASTSAGGVVQLTDSVSTTSSTLAATASAVKTSNDNANTRALANQTMHIGTTAVAINRASATLNLTGIGNITTSGTIYTPNRTSFLAYKTNGPTLAPLGIILFNNIAYNVGSAYNSSTGRFTVPIAGKYFISACTHGVNSQPGDIRIEKNGAIIAHAYGGPPDGQVVGTICLDLAANDYIHVYSVQTYRGDAHTWFTGFWIG